MPMSSLKPTAPHRHEPDPASQRWILDLIAGSVLILAPLFMAGRHPSGKLVYFLLTGTLALATLTLRPPRWSFSTIRSSSLFTCVALALLILFVQILPVRPLLGSSLNAALDSVLPAWNASDGLMNSVWKTFSLAPTATRLGIWILFAHALWFAYWMHRIQTPSDLRYALRMAGLCGVWIALVGLAQYLFGNGRFLWVYENPFREARGVLRGPFYNENHCAHLLALCWPCLWWWMDQFSPRSTLGFSESRRVGNATLGERWLLGVGLVGVLLAGLLTRSRGGILMLGLSVVTCVVSLLWVAPTRQRRWLPVASVAAWMLAALWIHGMSEVQTEFASMASASIDQIDPHGARRSLWQAAWKIGCQFPVFGAGGGSFREVYPLYYDPQQHIDYSYAESGYLHVLAETGWCGLSLLLFVLALIVRRFVSAWRTTRRDPELRSALVVCGSSLLVSGLHSVFDFVWFIPACLSVTLVLLACIWRIGDFSQLSQSGRGDASPGGRAVATNGVAEPHPGVGVPSWAWQVMLALVGLGCLELWPSARASLPWESYLRLSSELESQSQEWQDPQQLARMRRLLEQAVRFDPRHARARFRLAEVCLREFEYWQQVSDNPMALSQIRDAAFASEFRTRQDLDEWLQRLLGPRRILLDQAVRQARIGLREAPLHGEAYVYLSELSFLYDPSNERPSLWLQQALVSRPLSGAIRFAAGHREIVQGRLEPGLTFWRDAFQLDRSLRPAIVQQVAPRIPADLFIRQFRPELADLASLHDFYESQSATQDARVVAQYYLDRIASDHAESHEAGAWQRAYAMASKLSDPRAAEFARQAVRSEPDNYTMRRRLALELLASGAYSEAAGELRWCLAENPRDHSLLDKLTLAREQLDGADR